MPFTARRRQMDSSGELVILAAFKTDPREQTSRAVGVVVCPVGAIPGNIVAFRSRSESCSFSLSYEATQRPGEEPVLRARACRA